MPIPVMVLARRDDYLLRATMEALRSGSYADVHLATTSHAVCRATRRRAASITTLAAGDAESMHVNQMLAQAEKARVEALVPVHLAETRFVARHRAALAAARPILTLDPVQLDVMSDKIRFAAHIGQLGFSVPPWQPLGEALHHVEDAVVRIGLPMVAKPAHGEGGAGIMLIRRAPELAALAQRETPEGTVYVQRWVPGEDVAMTLLADDGNVFAVMLRKRWFTRRNSRAFGPICDVEFFRDEWLEELGRSIVRETRFSGIADFDLRVDFSSRVAWFLECDPRMMGTLTAARVFGVNIPRLLVDRATGRLAPGECVYNETGHFLSLGSLSEWCASGSWRQPRRGPIRTRLCTWIRDHDAPVGQTLAFG